MHCVERYEEMSGLLLLSVHCSSFLPSLSLEVQQTFERDHSYFMTGAASSKSKRTMIESGSLLCLISRVVQTCVAKYRSNAKAAVFDYRILLFTQIGIFLNFAEIKLKKRGKFEKNPI